MTRPTEMAGFVISADKPDHDAIERLEVEHLSPIAGELLRRCARCRSAGGIMALTPFTKLAHDLAVTCDELRGAMWELADAGHGQARYDTVLVQSWTTDIAANALPAAH